jgi:ribosomal protein S18 acetylase RimI-like enzyme
VEQTVSRPAVDGGVRRAVVGDETTGKIHACKVIRMVTEEILVERERGVSDALMRALDRLLPQISPAYRAPSRQIVERMLAADGTFLFVARDPARGGEIVGTLTLVVFRVPSGARAWIEDVAVDSGTRGRGVGEALSRAALEQAAALGVPAVDLTSRPARVEANRLYRRLGFVLRETNILRYRIAGE